jgi:ribose transport system substrate-binding protein
LSGAGRGRPKKRVTEPAVHHHDAVKHPLPPLSSMEVKMIRHRLTWFAAAVGAVLAHGSAHADAAQDGLGRAQAVVAAHEASPVFTPPGAPFDIRSCAAGKTMLSIPNNSANEFLRGIIKQEVAVGKTIGLGEHEWQNQGQPSQWEQGMNYAMARHITIVDLISGVNPAVLQPQLIAASKAGVSVFASHFYDPSQPPDTLLAGSLSVGFHEAGVIIADWMIARTGGHAHAIIVKSDEVPPTAPLVRGIEATLKSNCPGCTIDQEINVGITQWGTEIQPSVQASLQAHPDVNFVVPIYDSMSQFVVPALALTGRAARVKIATFNGTPFVLDLLRQGKVDMDIGESLDWIARATIDGYLRKLCGLPMPQALNVPLYIFDARNVATAGVPAEQDKGYGDAYIKGFDSLWHIR